MGAGKARRLAPALPGPKYSREKQALGLTVLHANLGPLGPPNPRFRRLHHAQARLGSWRRRYRRQPDPAPHQSRATQPLLEAIWRPHQQRRFPKCLGARRFPGERQMPPFPRDTMDPAVNPAPEHEATANSRTQDDAKDAC